MKEITLKQYIEVVRTVKLTVEDNCTEEEAAMELSLKSLCLDPNDPPIEDDVTIISDWSYVSETGIENENGESVVNY